MLRWSATIAMVLAGCAAPPPPPAAGPRVLPDADPALIDDLRWDTSRSHRRPK